MPVLIADRLPAAAEVRPFWGDELYAIAQGLEGIQMRQKMLDVSRHWQAQAAVGRQTVSDELIGQSECDFLDALQDYQPVPFEVVGKRRVRYVEVRDLHSRSFDYSIDQDDV